MANHSYIIYNMTLISILFVFAKQIPSMITVFLSGELNSTRGLFEVAGWLYNMVVRSQGCNYGCTRKLLADVGRPLPVLSGLENSSEDRRGKRRTL